MNITGLFDLITHLSSILLVWLCVFTILYLIKKYIFKSMGILSTSLLENYKPNKDEKRINGIFSILNNFISLVVFIFILVSCIFLYNPIKANYNNSDKIGIAKIDDDFKNPSKEQIKKENKEVINKKSNKKKIEAEKANTKAMEDAFKTFDEIIKKEQ